MKKVRCPGLWLTVAFAAVFSIVTISNIFNKPADTAALPEVSINRPVLDTEPPNIEIEENVLKPEQISVYYEYGEIFVKNKEGKLVFSYTQDWEGYPLIEVYRDANIIDLRTEVPEGFKRIGGFP